MRTMRQLHDDINDALIARGLNTDTFKLKLNSKSDDYEASVVLPAYVFGYSNVTLILAFGRTAEAAMEELLTLIREG